MTTSETTGTGTGLERPVVDHLAGKQTLAQRHDRSCFVDVKITNNQKMRNDYEQLRNAAGTTSATAPPWLALG